MMAGPVEAGTPVVTQQTAALFAFLFASGAMLASAETAITTLWPWKVRELANEEPDSKGIFSVLEKDVTRYLTTILMATTLSTIYSTSIATEVAMRVFGSKGVAYVTAGMTVFFLFFGEILPKSLAVHNAEKVARVMLPTISVMSSILYPLGQIMAYLSRLIMRLFKLPYDSETSVTEQELRLIVAGAGKSGSIEEHEQQLINNVLDLETTEVHEVMRPRVEIVALDSEATISDFLAMEQRFRFSRIPVYKESIDQIFGIVYAKSLLKFLVLGDTAAATNRGLGDIKVAELAEAAFFIPESMPAWRTLEELRRRRLHMAIVVDEYGGTAGLVTLEDILEEVVGEIYDEDDEDAPNDFVKDANGVYSLEGQADLELVCAELGMKLEKDELDDYDTLSGFLCHRMEGIPELGDTVTIDSFCFEVKEADDKKIIRVTAELISDPSNHDNSHDSENTASSGTGDEQRKSAATASAEKEDDDRQQRRKQTTR